MSGGSVTVPFESAGPNGPDLLSLATPYALHALTDAEADRFAAHAKAQKQAEE